MLFPEEARHLGAAVLVRAREFAAGRLCARRAMIELGGMEVPLEVDRDRQPHWPPLFTGSITHTEGFCGAVVARRSHIRSLGLDAEVLGRVLPEMWPEIMTPVELAWLQTLAATTQLIAATSIFSAKEAFFKCQFAVTGEWLDFHAVAVGFSACNSGHGTFAVRPLVKMAVLDCTATPLVGRFGFCENLVLTGMAFVAS